MIYNIVLDSAVQHSDLYMHMWVSSVAQMVKNLPTMQKTLGSIPVSGRFPGEGNGNPLQYSCVENSMDTGPGELQLQSMGSQRVGND